VSFKEFLLGMVKLVVLELEEDELQELQVVILQCCFIPHAALPPWYLAAYRTLSTLNRAQQPRRRSQSLHET
jgi:hypothetical protein